MRKQVITTIFTVVFVLTICGIVSAADTRNSNLTSHQQTVQINSEPQDDQNLPDPYNTRTGISYITIQEAIDSTSTLNGDTIQVETGTYPENVLVWKSLHLIATGPANVYSFTVNTAGSGSEISGFNVTGGSGNGITLTGSDNCNIHGNTISGYNTGIILNNSDNNTIHQNNIHNSITDGINLVNSDYSKIEENIVSNNGGNGINVENCNKSEIYNNIITQNSLDGIFVGSENITIKSNTISDNHGFGVRIFSSNQIRVIDNIITGNVDGIELLGSLYGKIIENTISSNSLGIYVSSSAQSMIFDNIIKNNDSDGLYILDDVNSLIDSNQISNNDNGLHLDNSVNISINNNEISDNTSNGIILERNSYKNVLYQNDITSNNQGIYLTVTSGENQLHFNRIVSNVLYGLVNGLSGEVDAQHNWWGYNDAAAVASQILNTGTGSVEFDAWVLLSITANPTNVDVGGNSNITVDLLHYSDGSYHNVADGVVPFKGLVDFNTTIGTTNDALMVYGQATSNLSNLNTPGTAIVSAKIDGQTVFTNVNIGSCVVTINQLITAANSVKAYYELHHNLPAQVIINNQTISMPQLLYLLITGTINIQNGVLTPVNIVPVNPAPNPSGTFNSGNIQKSEYLNVAQGIKSFINTNGRAPNYFQTSLGKIPFPSLVYMYSKIINFCGINNRLPNYVVMTP